MDFCYFIGCFVPVFDSCMIGGFEKIIANLNHSAWGRCLVVARWGPIGVLLLSTIVGACAGCVDKTFTYFLNSLVAMVATVAALYLTIVGLDLCGFALGPVESIVLDPTVDGTACSNNPDLLEPTCGYPLLFLIGGIISTLAQGVFVLTSCRARRAHADDDFDIDYSSVI